jgi:hypothetical protein
MRTTDAINHFGSQVELAKALEITEGAVSQWGDHPPVLRQYQIQALTKGKLKADPKKAAH